MTDIHNMTAASYNASRGLLDLKPDPRTADWLLVSNPLYTLGLCLSYVYIAKFLGPKLMENRKPFQLKNTLIFYNFFQVTFSIFLFYQIGMGGWFTGEYSLKCQPIDYSNKPSTIRMVHASWWYFFSKFTEFFDTLFFVLRKKFDHITTLHVIHHGIMPMSVWFGVKYYPGGHSTFFGLLNTFVHIVMYFYYFLTALGPQVQKYLWWKKYLTTFQMIQFVAIMVHAFQLLFIDCNFPKLFVWWIGSHAVLFFFLFKDFYQRSYRGGKKAASNKSKEESLVNDSNGVSSKQNGAVNSASKSNGVVKDASDYYVSGVNGATQLHQRLKDQ
ncbi:very long chain fatty acid elongase AAEL008004-like [Euwallacea similis]|uniref:very long chain fatty acid elongase AAEL008004-like n=1 Tax=Euwallacea similis TaxID=1736056 RepID=UPI00344DB595